MTQVLDEFEKLLEESFSKSHSVADIVEGSVLRKDQDGYLISVRGAKTEAFLSNKEISSAEEETPLEIGDVREFYVLKEEHDEEGMLLSLKRLAFAQAWAQLNDAKVQGDTILAKVVSVVKGGVLVDVADLKGFIPSSQLRTGTPFDGLIDQKIEVKVLEADPKKNKLILSQRQAVAEQRDQVVDNILSELEVDQVVKGEVVRITDFGAFIDIGGIDGLLPLSQLSWRWIDHPTDILKVGDKIDVEVISVDHDKQRVSLSLKNLEPDPWIEAAKAVKEGDKVEGSVTRLKHFGAFIEVFPGVEALLPHNEVVDYQNENDTILKVGDKINTYIMKFNPDDKRIALSVHELSETQPEE